MNEPVTIPVNHNLIGTCSKCGGMVVSPIVWSSSGTDGQDRPVFCVHCGARTKEAPKYGPVIEMQ
jgi:hypothetical protein